MVFLCAKDPNLGLDSTELAPQPLRQGLSKWLMLALNLFLNLSILLPHTVSEQLGLQTCPTRPVLLTVFSIIKYIVGMLDSVVQNGLFLPQQ